ncbi:NADH dehydrogenase [ubiquinone] 1 beta subcomplex subunit 1 isoform X1 [Lynx canadensis]|uniref:NADH dehydrogenase [ubiquinone] 1 beta subcomplex subunit 1 isoform X1 n=1 Tax=Lynx canadensis TaxID=61383 RepID=UPI0011AFE0C2|nr:NADH dehydrogenase [ubiquinone] 1 beta subcomplex subunit 1 isoform X1 [Lynx canadensis]
MKRKKRFGFPPPPLSSSGRGEWQVPRPQLPPAPVAGLASALGRGVFFGTKAAGGSRVQERRGAPLCRQGRSTSRKALGGAFMMNVIQIVRDHWVHILVPVGFVLGCYLDKKNDEKLTAFRNKSLLFKRELRPNEEVTWK